MRAILSAAGMGLAVLVSSTALPARAQNNQGGQQGQHGEQGQHGQQGQNGNGNSAPEPLTVAGLAAGVAVLAAARRARASRK